MLIIHRQKRIEKRSDLFDFRRGDTSPVLLLLDRRDDPVTPLLHQWTYQAMVHEPMGIQNNRVSLRAREFARSWKRWYQAPNQTNFWAEYVRDFRRPGAAVRTPRIAMSKAFWRQETGVDRCVGRSLVGKTAVSLLLFVFCSCGVADMKSFIEQYPEFRKLSGSVSKHVAIMGELARLVEERQLMDVSQVEQELACQSDHSSAYKVYFIVSCSYCASVCSLVVCLFVCDVECGGRVE